MTTTGTRLTLLDPRQRIAEVGARLRLVEWSLALLLAELLGAFALHFSYRDHTYLSASDEAIHAVVAEHVAAHPLTPTLYEIGALSTNDARLWPQLHVWLQVPPLGMWASAVAMRVLGNTPFADRLPGLFFVLGGMIVVYVLSCRLFGPGAGPSVGLVGAAFAGFTPYALLMSQGYYFGDTTDTPLMLLAPLVVLGIVLAYQSGKLRWLVLAGVAQGLCYLDKGGLSLAPSAVLLGLLICERAFPPVEGWVPLGWRGLAVFAGALAVVAVPYNLYLALTYPSLYAQTLALWKANIFTSVENWGRPLDYYFTSFLYGMYGPALALLLLVAGVVVSVVALRRRSRADLVVALWIVAFYLPLSLAVSKRIPLTYAAVPALGLAVGRLVQLGLAASALRARVATLGLLVGTTLAAVLLTVPLTPYVVNYALLQSPSLAAPASQSPLYRLVPYLYALAASALTAALIAGLVWLPRWPSRWQARVQSWADWHTLTERTLPTFAVAVTVVALAAYWLGFDINAVRAIPRKPQLWQQHVGAELTQYTPADATLIAAQHDQVGIYHVVLMFWSQRDIYPEPDLTTARVCELVQQAAAVHSPLYVVAQAPELPADASHWQVHATLAGGSWTIYQPRCP